MISRRVIYLPLHLSRVYFLAVWLFDNWYIEASWYYIVDFRWYFDISLRALRHQLTAPYAFLYTVIRWLITYQPFTFVPFLQKYTRLSIMICWLGDDMINAREKVKEGILRLYLPRFATCQFRLRPHFTASKCRRDIFDSHTRQTAYRIYADNARHIYRRMPGRLGRMLAPLLILYTIYLLIVGSAWRARDFRIFRFR